MIETLFPRVRPTSDAWNSEPSATILADAYFGELNEIAPPISHVASAVASSSDTCAKPSGVVAGDCLVAAIYTNGGMTGPAGWTQQQQAIYGSAYLTVFTYIAGASEPASYTWTPDLYVGFITIGISAYRGVDPITPLTGTPTQADAASASVTVGSITTGSADALLVKAAQGYISSPGLTWTGGGATRWEDTSSGVFLTSLTDEYLASAGATGSRTATLTDPGGTPWTLGVMLALNPAAPAITNTAAPVTVALQATGTRTATSTAAALQATGSRIATGTSVALLGAATRTSTPITAALQATGTRTASASAALTGTATRTAAASTALAVASDRTSTPVTASLLGTATRTATGASAALQATQSRTATATTALLATRTRTASATIATHATQTRTAAATITLGAGSSRTATPVTVALSAVKTRTATATAAVQETRTRTAPATLATQATVTRTALVSMAIVASSTRTAPASITLGEALGRLSATISHRPALQATTSHRDTLSAVTSHAAALSASVDHREALDATFAHRSALSAELEHV